MSDRQNQLKIHNLSIVFGGSMKQWESSNALDMCCSWPFKQQIFISGGHWLPLYMHVPILELQNILGYSWRIVKLNNIASIVRVAIKYLLELFPQNGVRPWAQITGSWGTCSHPPKKLAKMRKNGKNHTKIEKVMTRTSKLALSRIFFRGRWLRLNPRGVNKSRFQPANHSHFVWGALWEHT